MNTVAIIPARYASSRFPGKPLVDIAGKTMIEHVYRRAAAAASVTEVWIATDDERIRAAVTAFGGNVLMTRPDHPSGTDRIAEAARSIEADVIVNVQGDEPLIDAREIDAVAAPFAKEEVVMTTMGCPLGDPRDVNDPGIVKVVVDRAGFALYFSRCPIPFHRGGMCCGWLKHFGLYAYRRDFLFTLAALEPTPLERTECLEQLRALEHGYRIRVVTTDHDSISVDTPEDLDRVRALMAAGAGGTTL